MSMLLCRSAAAEDVTSDTGTGPAYRFGDAHQLAISSDAAFQLSHTSPADVTTITLAPAADYFVAENISVGGIIGVDYAKADRSHAVRFEIGPRVGYNFAFGDHVSIWPKVGLAYSHTSVSNEQDLGAGTLVIGRSNNGLALNIFAPVMFLPAEHFFAGFGPFLDTDLTGNDQTTTFGFRLSLGGWVQL